MKIPSEKKHVQKINVFAGLLAKHAYAAKKHDAHECVKGVLSAPMNVKTTPKRVRQHLTLPDEMDRQLRAAAVRTKRTKTSLIEDAVKKFLAMKG